MPTVLLQTGGGDRWTAFAEPIEILIAHRVDDVPAVVEAAEQAAMDGLVACGFLSYEAAPAFDSALLTRSHGDLPLAWFALFEADRRQDVRSLLSDAPSTVAAATPIWKPSIDYSEYARAIARIHDWIAAGDTYQVNYTLRLRAPFGGDAAAYFADLAGRHRHGHAAWIDTGRHAICSLSPELFFRLDGDHLSARPMKGTAPRGRTTAEDDEISQRLRHSSKDRAENVMIVDMVRNDLGRVARPGSVRVSSLWEVERYPTLFQMTSTCEAETGAPLTDILAALFPSASITGAPKIRTMQLITELEDSPRGIYTGAIGRIGPGRRASFNVAIRTVHIDRESGSAEYGTGGGIVWDSVAEREYDECLTKALVVTSAEPEFALLETLHWDPDGGFDLLDRHLERLLDSADYFGRPVDAEAVRRRLRTAVEGLTAPQRVRLLIDEDGSIEVETGLLERLTEPRSLVLAPLPVDATDPFLHHKTTHRGVYERAVSSAPPADDVLLWNTRGEITESTIANVVVELDGELLTPPLSSGLLAGTLRAELIAQGRIREGVILRQDLPRARALYLINSVRGRLEANLIPAAETRGAETT